MTPHSPPPCSGYEVLGRATLDVRVCSSLSRDRSAGEKKQKKQERSSSEEEEEEQQTFTNGRKRGKPVGYEAGVYTLAHCHLYCYSM